MLESNRATSRAGTVTGYSGTKKSGGTLWRSHYIRGTWFLSLTERRVRWIYGVFNVRSDHATEANVYKCPVGDASGLVVF